MNIIIIKFEKKIFFLYNLYKIVKMRTIDSNKIVGVRIWKNEKEAITINHLIIENNNSFRIIEFKKLEDVDKLIKDLKEFKKSYFNIINDRLI